MRYLGFALLVAAFFVTGHFWGPIGRTRLMGLCFMAYSVYGWFAWQSEPHALPKAWVLVPLFVAGLAFAAYAPAITCALSRYEHLCR